VDNVPGLGPVRAASLEVLEVFASPRCLRRLEPH
jgi:hypothetical protein